MAGVLLEGVQIDSKSGILTLFGPKQKDVRSVAFEVNYYSYMLVAYNLLPGQTVTLYSVAMINGTTRESVFRYNGNTIVLTAENPTALVAFTGMYRLVSNMPVGNMVLRAYPQVRETESVAPVKSDIINSLELVASELSPVQQIRYKAHTVTAYDLVDGDTVDIFASYEGYVAYLHTLTFASNTYLLDKTGDYRFLSSRDTVLTIRPNYIEFDNPYITKGEKGDIGPQGPAGSGAAYVHNQSTPSATWTINHNLGFKPSVELLTVGGAEFDAEVTHTSINQTIVSAMMPIAGTARLN